MGSDESGSYAIIAPNFGWFGIGDHDRELICSATVMRYFWTYDQHVTAGVDERLQAFFAAQGTAPVVVEHAAEPPALDPTSGKYRQVWSAR